MERTRGRALCVVSSCMSTHIVEVCPIAPQVFDKSSMKFMDASKKNQTQTKKKRRAASRGMAEKKETAEKKQSPKREGPATTNREGQKANKKNQTQTTKKKRAKRRAASQDTAEKKETAKKKQLPKREGPATTKDNTQTSECRAASQQTAKKKQLPKREGPATTKGAVEFLESMLLGPSVSLSTLSLSIDSENEDNTVSTVIEESEFDQSITTDTSHVLQLGGLGMSSPCVVQMCTCVHP